MRFRKNGDLIYGEITTQGILDLIEYMKHTNMINKNSVFMDIGCGYGMVTKLVKDLLNIRTIGIELDPEKAKIATTVTRWTIKESKKVEIYSGNFVDYPELINEATIIFSNCVAFNAEITETLIKMIDNTVFIHNSEKINRTYCHLKQDRILLPCTWSATKQPFYKMNTINN
jgi:16S rRNA A1518/A1519 N6-dimethyltransferase RsmA/KsgA/DIM1 with predicted DNA glycosylase/AP lyase activity